MQVSNYNYILEKEGWSYWYNGLEHTFFRLPLSLGNKIKAMIEKPNTLYVANEHFYQKLVRNGFLIEDGVNELDLIRKRNDDEVNKKDYFLIVLPTLNCNFKCWYCIQDHIPSMMSIDTINKVKAHIDYMINERHIISLHLEWFGGEPFMFFQKVIKPISLYAKEVCEKNNIPFYNSATTNGYYLVHSIIDDLKDLRFKKFHITLDGVQDEHDKVKFQSGCPSAFQRSLHNIENILSSLSDVNLLLRINYTEKNLNNLIINQINSIISSGNRNRITITLKKVWQEATNKCLSTKIDYLLDLFEKSGYNVIRLDLVFNFVSCYADRKYYNAINFNGNIVKCTACDDLYSKESLGYLNDNGAIVWHEGFEEKYFKKRFENEKCLKCKNLPVCMGMCPRNYNNEEEKFYCKMEGFDTNIEANIINFINSEYEKSK